MKIVTTEEMRALESRCALEGVSADTLMEKAGLAVAQKAREFLGDVRGVGKVQTTLAMAIDHVGPAAVGIDQQIGTSGSGSLKLGCGVEDVELSALAWRGLT